jgi:predicted nuclease with TOPRIM domain
MEILLQNIQQIALGFLSIVFIVGYLNTNSQTPFYKSLSNNASTYLTSIGIFFTFLGIFLALREFNVNNINTAVPKLLDGLKLAFLSSVCGIGGSIIYRIIRPLKLNLESSDDVTGGDLLEQLVKLNKGTESVKDALVGEGDSSLSTQMIKLRNDFRDFAEKVTEDGSNALIKALEEVMRDFNAKINEQFGENFKQLNEAVTSLLEWQKEHKKQVEELTEIFRETQKGIDTVKDNIVLIETSTGKIPEQMSKVEDAFTLTEERMVELHGGLSSLSEMRTKAEDALPHIEKQLTGLTEGLATSINNQMDSISQIFESQSNKSAETENKFNGVLDSLNMAADGLLETTKDTSDQVKGIIVDFQKQQSDLSRELQDTLKASVDDIEKTLNQSVTSLDSSMQQTLQRSLDMLGQNLTAISKRFVDTYEPFADRVSDFMNKTNRNG